MKWAELLLQADPEPALLAIETPVTLQRGRHHSFRAALVLEVCWLYLRLCFPQAASAESDQHFVADGSGVVKTRSVKRHLPSRQADLALLQSVTAHPWDPTGSKAETDTFVFPGAKRSEEATAVDPSNFDQEQQQSTEPLAPGDLQEVEDLLAW